MKSTLLQKQDCWNNSQCWSSRWQSLFWLWPISGKVLWIIHHSGMKTRWKISNQRFGCVCVSVMVIFFNLRFPVEKNYTILLTHLPSQIIREIMVSFLDLIPKMKYDFISFLAKHFHPFYLKLKSLFVDGLWWLRASRKLPNLTFTTAIVGLVIGLPPCLIRYSSPSIIRRPQLKSSLSVFRAVLSIRPLTNP